MAYIKIMYQNSPSTATPINAENLNHMDDQIALNDQRLTEIETSYVKSFNGRKGEVVPENGDYDIGQISPLTGAQVGQVPVVVNVGTEEDPELKFAMGAGGGGGHVIQNASGTDMPQESAMQFPDSHVSDDSTNGRTVVENIKEVASADYSSETEDGMYLIPDGEGAVIGPASDDKVEVTADGVKTYGQLFNELYAEIDATKINAETYLFFADSIWKLEVLLSNALYFHREFQASDNNIYAGYVMLSTSSSHMWSWEIKTTGSTTTSATSDKPSNGTKLTLYYGNKKATVDLQTTANRCWMSDGVTTVEQAINKGSVSVTADGNKTYDTLFAELHNLIDSTKITIHSVLQVNKNNYRIWVIDGSNLYFTAPTTLSSSPYVSVTEIALSWGGNAFTVAKAGTGADNNLSLKPSNGTKITLYY